MLFIWSRKIKHISTDQIKTVLRLWLNATRCSVQMKSTKVTFYGINWRHCYGALRKDTEGWKVEFYKRMHCHSSDFIRFCMQNDCCGCCRNKQDGGWRISSLRRKTEWVFANFLERLLHYKVNNHLITKNKMLYHTRNINRWKGSVVPCPFIGLLILVMINHFIFGHGVVIYYLYGMGKNILTHNKFITIFIQSIT